MKEIKLVQSRSTVQRHLAAAKRELDRRPDRGKYAYDLQLKISHLECALRNWIDGVSEYKFIV